MAPKGIMMAADVNREQDLEDQVALLKQQLDAFMGSSEELGVLMALRMGMTHRLAMILYILVKRAPAVISRNTFHTIMYADRLDGGPEPKIFNVHIHRLRGVLRRLDCPGKIDTIWHAGFKANPELVKWVEKLFEQQISREK